ncbi:MAG: DNA repair protein RecO [Chitinophagales bacterium]|nr:DNA repair protein RecO [Chitinophagales bacterium]MDW8274511.1 DNA repair protein RecO [Chitinophagales bacterium]
MIVTTRAISLQSVKYGETSLVAKLYTEQLGTVSYMINGIRSSKGIAKAALFQPCSLLEIQAYHRENKNLQRLKDYRRGALYTSIPFNMQKSAIAQIIIETLHRCVRQAESNPPLFDWIWNTFLTLDRTTYTHPEFHLLVMMKITSFIGIEPHGYFSEHTPLFDLKEGSFVPKSRQTEFSIPYPNSMYLSLLKTEDLNLNKPLMPNHDVRNEILQILLHFFRLHIPEFGNIKSVEVLQSLFR